MSTKGILQFVYSAAGVAAVSVCSAAPPVLSTTHESFHTPASSHTTAQADTPTAEFLLLRLIDLIKQSTSVQHLTPDRVSAVMQRPVTFFTQGRFGYRGTLTSDWDYTLEIEVTKSNGTRLDLEFIDATPRRLATATEICQIDFDRFASELANAGFSRITINGEHGIVVYDRFDRPNLSIKVSTRNAAPTPLETTKQSCVQLLTIQ